jgi:hypothetical protein
MNGGQRRGLLSPDQLGGACLSLGLILALLPEMVIAVADAAGCVAVGRSC